MARPISGDKNKGARFQAILTLIEQKQIGTQEDLAKELQKEGYSITQATLSRDIKELHLIKDALGNGSYAYRVPKEAANQAVTDQFGHFFVTSVLSVVSAMNQVIIKTYTGMAQAVCAALDGMKYKSILGTIAGDDTILIITPDIVSAKELELDLKEQLK